MRPISLAPLSARYLSLAEREDIAMPTAKGCGVREIAAAEAITIDDQP